MSDAFAPIVRARPNPIFGRPVHQGPPPFDYSPILLLKPFGFRITPDTLSSSEQTRWPTRHYPRLWIQRSSFERRRDFNPPDSCAAQRTLSVSLTSTRSSDPSHLFGLAGPTGLRLNRMDLPCSRCFLWLHAGGTNPGSISVSVREHLESSESFVIQGWRSDLKGRPCGRRRTAVVTTEAGYAIRAI